MKETLLCFGKLRAQGGRRSGPAVAVSNYTQFDRGMSGSRVDTLSAICLRSPTAHEEPNLGLGAVTSGCTAYRINVLRVLSIGV